MPRALIDVSSRSLSTRQPMCLAQKRKNGVDLPALGASTGTRPEPVTDFRILVVFNVGPCRCRAFGHAAGTCLSICAILTCPRATTFTFCQARELGGASFDRTVKIRNGSSLSLEHLWPSGQAERRPPIWRNRRVATAALGPTVFAGPTLFDRRLRHVWSCARRRESVGEEDSITGDTWKAMNADG